jgi:hypothetical protein
MNRHGLYRHTAGCRPLLPANSFSRAAEQCHVSQPSLSQQILKLEDELGARLFDRLGRSVRLTELGKAFLPLLAHLGVNQPSRASTRPGAHDIRMVCG